MEQELQLLKKYFKVTTFEKHPKAMMAIIFDRTMDNVLGKDFAKQRISKRKMKRIEEELKSALQSCYGRFINVSLRTRGASLYGIKFNTNFHHAYKTEFGTLYGAPGQFFCGQVFFTAHCFERFDERCDLIYRQAFSKAFVDRYKYEPTAADLVMLLTSTRENREYARKDKFYFLNIKMGFLVLEDFNELFVAKTFLTPDMLDTSLQWYKPVESTLYEGKTLKEQLDHDPVKITGPDFFGSGQPSSNAP